MIHAALGFKGRINRSTWNAVQLLNLMLAIIAWALLGYAAAPENAGQPAVAARWMALAVSATAAVFFLCSTVKRYHDRGKSGLWFLQFLIPGIGQTLIIFDCSRKGDPGPNAYGAPPGTLQANTAADSPGKFTKFDDAFFENYKAQQVTNQPPAAVATSPVEAMKPSFGRRVWQ